MGSITDMGLYVWDGATDPYNYQQLAQNFEILTFHDHTPGRGAQITSGALAPGSVGSVNFDTTAQSFISAASHLKYTAVFSLPFTASDGQFVVASTSGVYRLPAASTTNQTIVFVNNIAAGGTATITPAGADQIFVEGGWGIPTLQLGALGATVTLQSDGGSNWIARTTPGRLRFVVVGVNTTAAHGQLINAAPSVTVTLPQAGVNAVVGVMAFANVTATTPVTVLPSGGAHIYGPGLGLTGATSFVLGTANTCVVLQADGANWTMLSGQQDTGWKPLSLPANVNPNAGFYAPSYRLNGDTVSFSGQAINNTGGVVNTLGAIPSGFRPASSVSLPAATFDGTGLGSLTVASPSGNLNCQIGIGGVLLLDGLQYRLV